MTLAGRMDGPLGRTTRRARVDQASHCRGTVSAPAAKAARAPSPTNRLPPNSTHVTVGEGRGEGQRPAGFHHRPCVRWSSVVRTIGFQPVAPRAHRPAESTVNRPSPTRNTPPARLWNRLVRLFVKEARITDPTSGQSVSMVKRAGGSIGQSSRRRRTERKVCHHNGSRHSGPPPAFSATSGAAAVRARPPSG